jgi:hypothetical protein
MLGGIEGFKAVNLVYREKNYGLSKNLTEGISTVLGLHDAVVVLEDDMVTSPMFLQFVQGALEYYRDEPRVASICGYCYPLKHPVPETFFIRGADCWGWGTWRDRWRYYNPDGRELLSQLERRELVRAFNFGHGTDFAHLLRQQVAGHNDSWAIRWHASCFLNNLLTLYPARSLVQNIGQDGTGTHMREASSVYTVRLSAAPVRIGGIPIQENEDAREAFREFFSKVYPRIPLWKRVAAAIIYRLGLRGVVRLIRSQAPFRRQVANSSQ